MYNNILNIFYPTKKHLYFLYSFVINIYGLIMIKDLNNICSDVVFEKLFHKHAKDLRRFLFFKTKDIDSAEDILQDAFIKLWDNCAKVNYEKSKSFFIYCS